MIYDEMLRKALAEDIGHGDITTDSLDLDAVKATAFMVAKAAGVVAGVEVAIRTFKLVDKDLKITLYRKDSDTVKPGDEIMKIDGRASSILKGERVALNFLQRLSGIATSTKTMVDAMEGTNTKLLDTRKTTPGLRALEKYAVRIGGGHNHRFGLFDMVLLKENHIRACGGITEAVRRVKERNTSYKIEVEVTNLRELTEAVKAGADRVMLDNMTLANIRTAVKRYADRVELEVSGGVNDKNIQKYARTGVHYISSGAITHSYKSLDISLLFEEEA
ncbi:MAG TPA: carboxylating nicotinate-nucleotide diphosphorylase [Candidatus Cloacimonas sp.]|jgi:nicotinate-nucleotide pyrophosphorylase (carboxylating)|nr:carboxylating nicotinate-nucleotide diphosphorylase [Candidatus Cloacimonas sp.]